MATNDPNLKIALGFQRVHIVNNTNIDLRSIHELLMESVRVGNLVESLEGVLTMKIIDEGGIRKAIIDWA